MRPAEAQKPNLLRFVNNQVIVCIDGSGNYPDADREDVDTTNVFRLHEALEKSESRVVKYFPGVATSG
jgi:uncharacterized protein (DUF2235 family)